MSSEFVMVEEVRTSDEYLAERRPLRRRRDVMTMVRGRPRPSEDQQTMERGRHRRVELERKVERPGAPLFVDDSCVATTSNRRGGPPMSKFTSSRSRTAVHSRFSSTATMSRTQRRTGSLASVHARRRSSRSRSTGARLVVIADVARRCRITTTCCSTTSSSARTSRHCCNRSGG